jgi:hypothetical protein
MTLPSQPGTDIQVRFYYTNSDYDALQAAALSLSPPVQLSAHQQMIAYRINDPAGLYNEDPASGHTNIPKAQDYISPGFWEMPSVPAPAAPDNWMYINLGGGIHAADYVTKLPGGGGLGLGANGGGALPLLHIALKAAVSGGMADLTWSFTGNFQRFIVERSQDAANWSQIYSVKAPATQPTLVHSDPLPNAALAYYRILGITVGAKSVYSNITFAGNLFNGGVTIFPNPASQVVMVSVRSGFVARLLSLDGKLLVSQRGNGQTSIDVSYLPIGAYVLQVSDEKGHLLKVEKLSVLH